jgi:hypothetical protein
MRHFYEGGAFGKKSHFLHPYKCTGSDEQQCEVVGAFRNSCRK